MGSRRANRGRRDKNMNPQPHCEYQKHSGSAKAVVIVVLLLTAYVFLYPVYAILDYFKFISSDHGIGMVLHILYMPLGYLEQHSEFIRSFFRWLIDLISSPFF